MEWRLPHSLAGHCQGPASAPRVGGSKTFLEAPPGRGALECEQPQEMPLCPGACGGIGVRSSCHVAHCFPWALRPARVKVFSVFNRLWCKSLLVGLLTVDPPGILTESHACRLKGGPLARGDPRDVCPRAVEVSVSLVNASALSVSGLWFQGRALCRQEW